MKERLITTRTVKGSDGRTLTLRYFLLAERVTAKTWNFGVRVNEMESNINALVPGLTSDAQRVFDLIDMLVKGTVTPTGLMDVLADWL